MRDQRLDWDSYFLMIAQAVSLRAACIRKQVGAVLIDADRRIIATGYNGAPSGEDGCLEGKCPRGRLAYEHVPPELGSFDQLGSQGFCVAVHAELNALLYALRDTKGSTMYITHQPCPSCRKALRAAGVARVVWPNCVMQGSDLCDWRW